MRKTYICYDKNGDTIKYVKDGKEYIAGYYLKDLDELKQYITFDIYERTEYVKVLRYSEKSSKDENGNWKKPSEWKYANTKKYYIHSLWK